MTNPAHTPGYGWPNNYYDYGRPAGDYDYNYHPPSAGYYHPSGPAGYHGEVKVHGYHHMPPSYEYHQPYSGYTTTPPPVPQLQKYDYLGHSDAAPAQHTHKKPTADRNPQQPHNKGRHHRPVDEHVQTKKTGVRPVPGLAMPSSEYNYHQESERGLMSARSEVTGRESKDNGENGDRDRKTSRIFVGGLAISVTESRFHAHIS